MADTYHGVKVTVKVTGFEGVNNALMRLGPKLARQSLKKGFRAVGEMWKTELVSRAPIGSALNDDSHPGELKDSIAIKIKTRGGGKNGSPARGYVVVGPKWGSWTGRKRGGFDIESPGLYAKFVEFGLDKKNYTTHPFMRPTWDATNEKALALFAETLKQDLGL